MQFHLFGIGAILKNKVVSLFLLFSVSQRSREMKSHGQGGVGGNCSSFNPKSALPPEIR